VIVLDNHRAHHSLKVVQLLVQFYLKALKEIIIGIDFNAQVFEIS
jgi:hypothetical protein